MSQMPSPPPPAPSGPPDPGGPPAPPAPSDARTPARRETERLLAVLLIGAGLILLLYGGFYYTTQNQLESLPDGPEVEALRQELSRYPRQCALTLFVWAAAVGLAKLGFALARRLAAPPMPGPEPETKAAGAPEGPPASRAAGPPPDAPQ